MQSNRLSVISKKTPVTLGLVITLCGGVAWLTSMWAKANSNEKAIAATRVELLSTKGDIVDRLDRIEDKVDKILLRRRR